ncbi:neuronal PAS domain-containing protein 3-like [Schistocerca gregaria]|uniref:neuronal PAS domain-containing protein 3-like n=1 Tax=Schistocerca gregaria TaxID=7010 RepID=UPI00211EFCCA|nr:neuronal PAS domain-containing protein 3-like [Schistocerca gregaria]
MEMYYPSDGGGGVGGGGGGEDSLLLLQSVLLTSLASHRPPAPGAAPDANASEEVMLLPPLADYGEGSGAGGGGGGLGAATLAPDDGPQQLFQGYSAALLQFATACCVVFILVGIPGNLITIVALFRCKKVGRRAGRSLLSRAGAPTLGGGSAGRV